MIKSLNLTKLLGDGVINAGKTRSIIRIQLSRGVQGDKVECAPVYTLSQDAQIILDAWINKSNLFTLYLHKEMTTPETVLPPKYVSIACCCSANEKGDEGDQLC